MQNKLQELTDKLYQEGLSKGKLEAEELLSKAKQEAQEIVEAAKEEAAQIVKNAQKESAELRSKTEGDIKMASVQTLSGVKQRLESAVTFKSVKEPLNKALNDSEFLKEIVKSIATAFSEKSGGKTLNMILPESQKGSIENYLKTKITEFCKSDIEISYSRDIQNGFKIGEKGEGYYLDFTADSFERIIAEYLRPKTRKLLFGE